MDFPTKIDAVAPQSKESKKGLSTKGVLIPPPPLFLPIRNGKREEEELVQEMHCQDNDVMVDAVVRAEVLFWMFLRAGLKYKFSVFRNHKHKISFGTGNGAVSYLDLCL
jgi:hypothetical protein